MIMTKLRLAGMILVAGALSIGAGVHTYRASGSQVQASPRDSHRRRMAGRRKTRPDSLSRRPTLGPITSGPEGV